MYIIVYDTQYAIHRLQCTIEYYIYDIFPAVVNVILNIVLSGNFLHMCCVL